MKFYIVDCFAKEKYQGNQLAVFILDQELSSKLMQTIAREINFSETTFITPKKEANGGYKVRIFTPDVEVPFAGHPTLGSAYVINQVIENNQSKKVIINLEVGAIAVYFDENKMTMVQNQPEFGQIVEKNQIAKILQIQPSEIADNLVVQWVSTGLPCFIVPLKNIDSLKKSSINHDLFKKFIEDVYKCNLLIFAKEGENQLRVRVFLDDTGFLEDPATGSANGNLVAYLLKYNYFKNNKACYKVSQGSEMGRPSTIEVVGELVDDNYNIKIGGKACMVAKGDWEQ